MDKILVLAAHADDAEIACGGTISKFLKRDSYIHIIVFSIETPGSSNGILKKEFIESMRRFRAMHGGDKLYFTIYNYQMRMLNYSRQAILDEMFALREKYQPDMVFVPSRNDLHKDHLTISEEGIRAFKGITTLGYEMPWNNITFDSHGFIDITAEDLYAKINALEAYKSQAKKNYMQPDYIRSLAKTRGVQAGCQFAEAFEVIRWILT